MSYSDKLTCPKCQQEYEVDITIDQTDYENPLAVIEPVKSSQRMKTEAEIRAAIANIQAWQRNVEKQCEENEVALSDVQLLLDRTDEQIHAFQWVLGERRAGDKKYWCIGCQAIHEGLTCPKCNSAREMKIGLFGKL